MTAARNLPSFETFGGGGLGVDRQERGEHLLMRRIPFHITAEEDHCLGLANLFVPIQSENMTSAFRGAGPESFQFRS